MIRAIYKENYIVTSEGEIYNKKTGRKLKFDKSSKYYRVQLGKYNKKESVHRIVASLFIPNTQNKPCVNHINGNRLDNRVNNLEWCTHSENEIHSRDVLKKQYANGFDLPQTKISKEESLKIKELFETGEYTKAKLGRMFNVSRKAIYRHI
jgi:DNA-binding XRE family transcriptional regulator